MLLGTGYSSWLLDGEGFFLPPICFHLHCDSSLWVLSVKGISLSPVPHFSLHCSVFFVLVALGTGLKSHLFSYSSLYFTLTCGCSLWVLPGHSMLLVLCLSPCLSPLFSPTHALTSLSLSLSLLFFSLGAYLDTWFSPVPHLSPLVLVCSLQHVSLIPSSLLLLLGKERISWPLVFLLNFSSFVQVTFPYPQSLPHVTLLTFLLVSNLSPYSLSTTVLLSRSPAFGTERIVFLLFPFFPSLSLLSFPALSSLLSPFLLFSLLGPKIPLVSHVPICVLIQPVFSYLLCGLGSRTSSFPFVPPCYCSFCWVLLGTEYFSRCSMAKDSSCLPFVSILVSLSVPNLSPYFSIFIAILLSGCFRSKESPCLPFLTSLSIAQCSSFWWLWGQDSSPICFRTRLSTSLSHVAVLSGCFRGTVCSLSSVCLRACPPCSLQLVPLLLFLSLSLSLLLFFFLGAYLDTWFSSSPICFRTCLPCSLQVVSFIPFPLPFFSQAPFWPPVFLSTFLPLLRPPYLSINCCLSLRALGRNHTKPIIRYIPLPSVSTTCFPTCLPTCLQVVSLYILSPLPCFFPGLQHVGLFYSSLSFLTCSSSLSQCLLHFSPHYCCSLWVLLGHRTFIVSSLFPDFAT